MFLTFLFRYSVQKGNAVVFFDLFRQLYVWVNGIQVIVELLHIFFSGDKDDYRARIGTTTVEDERQWK